MVAMRQSHNSDGDIQGMAVPEKSQASIIPDGRVNNSKNSSTYPFLQELLSPASSSTYYYLIVKIQATAYNPTTLL
jgi:hypothetical protein